MQLLCILFVLALPMTVYAETKTTTAETTYIMGEGETPAMAESKAFGAAKQKAVEQLIPFVAEQIKGRKYSFSPQQVRTITETTLEVELLEKKRTIVGERFQFTAKIKATLQQDKVLAEVAQKEKRLVAETLTEEGANILNNILRRQIKQTADKHTNYEDNTKATNLYSSDYEEALELFNRAINSDPTFAKAYAGRYRIYHYHLSEIDKALADITKAIHLEPDKQKQADYYTVRAMTYKEIGQKKRELEDYNDAILRDPKASYLWERGQLLGELGQHDKAILDYSRILESGLSKDEEWYSEFALDARATALSDLKQYDRAIADFTELIRVTNGKQGHSGRGLTYMRLGEYEKAALDFTEEMNQRSRRASKESPTELNWTKELFFQRALAYSQLGEYKKVIPDITEYLRHESESAKRRAFAYELRGRAYGATDNTEKALADYSEAIRADPQRPSAYYRRGGFYVILRQWDRAASDLTDALRLTMMENVAPGAKLNEDDLTTAYTFRGGAYLNLGYGEQAVSDLNEALRRNPKETQALFWRGLARAQLKDGDAARRDLQQACRLGHDKACEVIQSIH